MHLLRAGHEIPLTQRARYRWDAAQAVAWCVQAVDRLFAASGGRAIFVDHPIQRAFRDVHAIQAHAGNNIKRRQPSLAAPVQPPTRRLAVLGRARREALPKQKHTGGR